MFLFVLKPLVAFLLMPSISLATLPLPAPAVEAPPHASFPAVTLPQIHYPSASVAPILVTRDSYAVILPPPPPPPVVEVVPEPVEVFEPVAKEVEEVEDVATPPATFNAPGEFGGVVDFAMQFVGVVPYGWGASPDDSFGCDGLTQYVFGQFGVSLPRGADSQAALGYEVPASEAVAGGLVSGDPHRHLRGRRDDG
jgi:hypothetical protein